MIPAEQNYKIPVEQNYKIPKEPTQKIPKEQMVTQHLSYGGQWEVMLVATATPLGNQELQLPVVLAP